MELGTEVRGIMGDTGDRQLDGGTVRNGTNRGFSLIELVIVILILGILSVIIIPKVDSLFSSMRLKAAGDKLMDDLRLIHTYATARHDTTWLVVNLSENSYGIYSGPSASERELILDPSTNQKAVIDFDDQYNGVSITSVDFDGDDEFYFDWWGTPSSGGHIVLNGGKIINVVAESGYVYESQ